MDLDDYPQGADGNHAERIVIRPFAPDDQEAARDLILSGLGEHFGFVDQSLNPDLDDILTHYVLAGHTFLVALLEDTLVGTGALLQEEHGTGRLVRMSVRDAYRRRGIGWALADALLKAAVVRGLDCLVVETNHDWHEAIRLYQSLGFLEFDRDDESIHMRLQLG